MRRDCDAVQPAHGKLWPHLDFFECVERSWWSGALCDFLVSCDLCVDLSFDCFVCELVYVCLDQCVFGRSVTWVCVCVCLCDCV